MARRAARAAPRRRRGADLLSDASDDEDLPDAWESSAPPPAPALDGEFAAEAQVDEDAALGCIRCGNSCRSVYLWQGPLDQFKERDTKRWVEYHDLQTFTAKAPDGRLYWGVKLAQPCRFLITAEDGKAGCAIYDRRPYVCRIYRGVNPDGPQPGCGFNRAAPG